MSLLQEMVVTLGQHTLCLCHERCTYSMACTAVPQGILAVWE